MSFDQLVRIPSDRVGVLVGKEGSVKSLIEEKCAVRLQVDSASGEVHVIGTGDLEKGDPFKAVSVVTAIARGFSPQRAFRLLHDDATMDIMDLRPYAGKSDQGLARVKGRIIGLNGKARRLIEELTGAYLSIYGHTVTVIGKVEEVKLAMDAITGLASGRTHRSVYNMLQKARANAKLERLRLWED